MSDALKEAMQEAMQEYVDEIMGMIDENCISRLMEAEVFTESDARSVRGNLYCEIKERFKALADAVRQAKIDVLREIEGDSTLPGFVPKYKIRDMLAALEAERGDLEGDICPDCDGEGVRGLSGDGRHIACETCGGHEDSPGTGTIKEPRDV